MEELKSFGEEAETDNVRKFRNSLQELRDLCSHLHDAAAYCEDAFLDPKSNKAKMVENTKEYICRAVVTAVDHLGSVSAALEFRLLQSNSVAETELRIDRLKQRLFTWQQHSHKLSLTSHRWNAHFPRHYSRYISPPPASEVFQSRSKILRESDGGDKIEFDTEEVPLFLYTYNFRPCLVKQESESGEAAGEEKKNRTAFSVLPVRSGLILTPEAQQAKFQFQVNKILSPPKIEENSCLCPWLPHS